jgi:hypothetical protein
MSNINLESPSVRTYLNILQGVINRMATNSASSKTWCIALVSAIIVVLADQGKADYVWISVIPVTLFFLLDAYYLGLEKRFRALYDEFIQKLHTDSAKVEDVYIVTPGAGVRTTISSTIGGCLSFSVWGFYGLLALMLVLLRFLISAATGAPSAV